MIMLTPSEQSDVDFLVATLSSAARSLPCRDAAKLLRGFLAATDSDSFAQLRALHRSLAACDQQLELLITKGAA
jgi:hypothetical protein